MEFLAGSTSSIHESDWSDFEFDIMQVVRKYRGKAKQRRQAAEVQLRVQPTPEFLPNPEVLPPVSVVPAVSTTTTPTAEVASTSTVVPPARRTTRASSDPTPTTQYCDWDYQDSLRLQQQQDAMMQ